MTPLAAHIRIATHGDMKDVRSLCWAYRDLLAARMEHITGIVERYYPADGYDALLNELEAKHAPPDGAIFVAEIAHKKVGCGMIHRIDATTCEIKRVYVAPPARGLGIAKGLFQTAMDQARSGGYTRMVLDTMTGLTEAIALYHTLGFKPGAPFYEVDRAFADHILFFEAGL